VVGLLETPLIRLQFLTHHCAVITIITTHSKAIKSTGPYYDSLSRSINKQRMVVQNFRSAVEAKHADVKVRTVDQWADFNVAMDSVLEKFPLPTHIMVVE
jgi:hypothetical protein